MSKKRRCRLEIRFKDLEKLFGLEDDTITSIDFDYATEVVYINAKGTRQGYYVSQEGLCPSTYVKVNDQGKVVLPNPPK